jgi:hypothetical protein
MMLTGNATPQQLRLKNAQLAMETENLQNLKAFSQTPEGQKLLGGVPIGALDTVRKAQENEQVKAAIEGLRSQTGLAQSRYANIELPQSRATTAAAETATAASKQAMAEKSREQKDIVGQTGGAVSTPAGANLKLSQEQAKAQARQGAAVSGEHIAMLSQMIPDVKTRMSVMEAAGIDTTPFQKQFAEEEARKKALFESYQSSGQAGKKPQEIPTYRLAPQVSQGPPPSGILPEIYSRNIHDLQSRSIVPKEKIGFNLSKNPLESQEDPIEVLKRILSQQSQQP